MPKCEWCGTVFDLDEAESIFTSETYCLAYENITKCLCGNCAVQAIEDEVDGVYYETCEKCGKSFDLIEESAEFDRNFSWENGTSLRDYWNDQIICCDCALSKIENDEYK